MHDGRFKEIEQILYTKHSLVKKNGLQHIFKILERIGNPHKRIGRVIHITGTNGKGSVAYLCSTALMSLNKKVGLYTSPHIRGLTERIKINGKNISEQDFVRLYDYVTSFDEHLSFFEIVTLIMLKYFEEQNVDFSVIEVGIGGLYDTTNVVDAELCFITSIDYDHMNMLGPTLNDIAFQKAGIIKKDSICVVGEMMEEQLEVVKKVASQRGGMIFKVENFFDIKGLDEDYRMVLEDKRNLKRFKMIPVGVKQPINLSMVIRGLEMIGLNIELEKFYRMIENTDIEGRFQIVRISDEADKIVVLDGAHNPGAIRVLIENMRFFGFDEKRWTLVFSIFSNKDYKTVIKNIADTSFFDRVIITMVDNPKKLSPYLIANMYMEYKKDVDVSVVDSSKAAFEFALRVSDNVCVTGSFYLVSEIIELMTKRMEDFYERNRG